MNGNESVVRMSCRHHHWPLFFLIPDDDENENIYASSIAILVSALLCMDDRSQSSVINVETLSNGEEECHSVTADAVTPTTTQTTISCSLYSFESYFEERKTMNLACHMFLDYRSYFLEYVSTV